MDLGIKRLVVAEQRHRDVISRHQSRMILEHEKQEKIKALKQEEQERRKQLLLVRR